MPKPDVNSVDSIGGRAVFVRIFVRFYARLFKDPVMLQLFNETPEVRPPEEHGELLAAFLLEKIGHSAKPTYTELRGDGKGHGVGVAHTRASQCPMRPRNHQGRGFTFDQGHAWLGNLHHACGEMGVPDFFRDLLLQWLAVFLKSYAPFIDAHQEGNDPGRTCERRQIEGIGHQKEDSETRADQAFRALVLQIN
uniref:Uncharacterized protein n=1 Tax=Chromera velia CCMP2878 TaxID=1169474 RepID=A0A0G4FXN7_9ALVE|eukprot:Cvel_19296.t1-p1 / transcript=Cvel_19296.t1 / gene=Cvel_19296 / organism=Chromera_velia_CCMP2878 / gene_product=hypothetical protein / transcript_product=hypothetical protein / location=Cvel_scaffold1652:33893-34471(-) / protein_length=193 / sequence_SO=supercontig / SO=protein_coding / is_pseudo=false